jgi:dTMP kinase
MKARFITLEGSEGAGKTSALAQIKSQLEQWQVAYIATREPGGEETAEKIRDILLHSDHLAAETELLLMFAARKEHVQKIIKPALAQGTWVVSDRFVDASFAYQGYGRGIDIGFIEQLETLTVGSCQPDLTLWLDVEPKVGLERAAQRASKDRIESEDLSFFERIRQGYDFRYQADPQRIKKIDANNSIQTVSEHIGKILHQHQTWVDL